MVSWSNLSTGRNFVPFQKQQHTKARYPRPIATKNDDTTFYKTTTK